jgi:hypothetical protein
MVGAFDDVNRDSPLLRASIGRSVQPLSGKRGRKPRYQQSKQRTHFCHSPIRAHVDTNPLQDMMEAEKERMRAMMHQSFLQQLEQLPMSAALAGVPLEALAALLPGMSTNDLAALAAASGLGAFSTDMPTTSSGSKQNDDGALNLSTKKVRVVCARNVTSCLAGQVVDKGDGQS